MNRTLLCPVGFVTAPQPRRHGSALLRQKVGRLNCTVPLARASAAFVKEQPFANCEHLCVNSAETPEQSSVPVKRSKLYLVAKTRGGPK